MGGYICEAGVKDGLKKVGSVYSHVSETFREFREEVLAKNYIHPSPGVEIVGALSQSYDGRE